MDFFGFHPEPTGKITVKGKETVDPYTLIPINVDVCCGFVEFSRFGLGITGHILINEVTIAPGATVARTVTFRYEKGKFPEKLVYRQSKTDSGIEIPIK